MPIERIPLGFFSPSGISSYYAYDLPDKPEWGEKPAEPWFVKDDGSHRPDGITVGNREIYAALGIPELTAEQVYEYYSGSGEYNYHINPSTDFHVSRTPKKSTLFVKYSLIILKPLTIFVNILKMEKLPGNYYRNLNGRNYIVY